MSAGLALLTKLELGGISGEQMPPEGAYLSRLRSLTIHGHMKAQECLLLHPAAIEVPCCSQTHLLRENLAPCCWLLSLRPCRQQQAVPA